MGQLGNFTLALAWVCAVLGMIFGAYAGYRSNFKLTAASRALGISTFVLLLLSFSCLAAAFLNNDYTIQYVWQFSNRAMLPVYKISAIWGGMTARCCYGA